MEDIRLNPLDQVFQKTNGIQNPLRSAFHPFQRKIGWVKFQSRQIPHPDQLVFLRQFTETYETHAVAAAHQSTYQFASVGPNATDSIGSNQHVHTRLLEVVEIVRSTVFNAQREEVTAC